MCLKEIKRLRFFNSASFRPNPKQVFSPHGFDFSNSGQIPIEIEKVTIGKIRLELSCNPFHPWKRSKEERTYSDLIFTTDFTISSLGWGEEHACTLLFSSTFVHSATLQTLDEYLGQDRSSQMRNCFPCFLISATRNEKLDGYSYIHESSLHGYRLENCTTSVRPWP